MTVEPPKGGVDASVVICTRNRADSLARTLRSLSAMSAPAGAAWELLVVDNGGTDDTPAVVEGFADRLPVRRLFEPAAGLSNARNRALGEVAGDLVIWTDDDVEVSRGWLEAYLRVSRKHPQAAFFGGPARPVYDPPAVPWFAALEPHIPDLLAVRALGDDEIPLSPADGRMPFGLNYAVRAAIQKATPYDPDLGVAPGRRTGGEELDVLRRIIAAGGRGVWVPDALVLHHIAPERQSLAYIRQYYEAAGETRVAMVAAPDSRTRARGLLKARIKSVVWRLALTASVLGPRTLRGRLTAKQALQAGLARAWAAPKGG